MNGSGGKGPPDDRNRPPKNVGNLLQMCLGAQSENPPEEGHVVQPMQAEVGIPCNTVTQYKISVYTCLCSGNLC